MTLTFLLVFLLGLGVGMCGWKYHLTYLSASYALDLASSRAAAASLRSTIVRMRAERAEMHRAAMLETLTLPPVPHRYVVAPAPTLTATSPDPSVPDPDRRMGQRELDELEHMVQVRREALRCATVRRKYDRTMCFDIACPSCNPGPLDAATGALSLAEVAELVTA